MGAGAVGSELVSRLQEQNASLRAVVAQMRMDMEGLGGAPLPQPAAAAAAGTRAEAGAPASGPTAPPCGGTEATRPGGAWLEESYCNQWHKNLPLFVVTCRALLSVCF